MRKINKKLAEKTYLVVYSSWSLVKSSTKMSNVFLFPLTCIRHNWSNLIFSFTSLDKDKPIQLPQCRLRMFAIFLLLCFFTLSFRKINRLYSMYRWPSMVINILRCYRLMNVRRATKAGHLLWLKYHHYHHYFDLLVSSEVVKTNN